MKKHLSEGLKRELAVKASVDPKTILRAFNGEPVKGLAGDRARAALREMGLLEEPPPAAKLRK